MQAKTRTCVLPRLERAGLVALIDEYDSLPVGSVERAAMAVYLRREDDAEEAIAALPIGDDIAALLLADLRVSFGKPLEAAAILEPLPPSAYRSRSLARIALLASDWPVMALHAESTIELADEPAMIGLGLLARAIAREGMNWEHAETAHDFKRAAQILRDTEGLVFRAIAEMGLGSWYLGEGDTVGALALFDSAEGEYLNRALRALVGTAQVGRGWAEILEGRYVEAGDRARAVLEMSPGTAWAHRIAAIAFSFAGKHEDAIEHANALLRGATEPKDALEAMVVERRARARAGDAAALSDLERILARRRTDIGPLERARYLVMLADALLDHSIPRAFRARDTVETARGMHEVWLRAELRHLDARWTEQPIRRERGNVVIELNGKMPLRADAQLILDDVLVRHAGAKERTKTGAAKRLGLTRWSYWNLERDVNERLEGAAAKARRTRLQGRK